MATTKFLNRIAVISLILTVTACDSSSSSNSDGSSSAQHTCNLPCLDGAPVLDTASVSSATGGTVTMSFKLRGDITNVSNIVVFLSNSDTLTSNTTLDAQTLVFPSQAENTMEFVIDSDSPAGTYYPWISITANSPANSGNQYYMDFTKSTTRYTYAEVIEGSTPTPILTDYVIPAVQVK